MLNSAGLSGDLGPRMSFWVQSVIPSLASKIRIWALPTLPMSPRWTLALLQSSVCPVWVSVSLWLRSVYSWLKFEFCWSSNWIRSCRSIRTPTIVANAARITHVSAAEPPASRQRIGTDLYAEYVARAADRV